MLFITLLMNLPYILVVQSIVINNDAIDAKAPSCVIVCKYIVLLFVVVLVCQNGTGYKCCYRRVMQLTYIWRRYKSGYNLYMWRRY